MSWKGEGRRSAQEPPPCRPRGQGRAAGRPTPAPRLPRAKWKERGAKRCSARVRGGRFLFVCFLLRGAAGRCTSYGGQERSCTEATCSVSPSSRKAPVASLPPGTSESSLLHDTCFPPRGLPLGRPPPSGLGSPGQRMGTVGPRGHQAETQVRLSEASGRGHGGRGHAVGPGEGREETRWSPGERSSTSQLCWLPRSPGEAPTGHGAEGGRRGVPVRGAECVCVCARAGCRVPLLTLTGT